MPIQPQSFQHPAEWEKEFEKLFVHKGEDSDDPPEKWAWTIMGSYPIEVMAFIRTLIATHKARVREDERKRILEVFESTEMTPNISGYIGIKEAKKFIYDILTTPND